jgi:hypothetical protein
MSKQSASDWIDDDFDRALPAIIAGAGDDARASCRAVEARVLEMVREATDRALKDPQWQRFVRR